MGIRVLVNGAFGRMGQFVTKSIAAHPSLELAGQTGREYDLAEAIKDSKAQVVVDFTHPDSVFKNAMTAWRLCVITWRRRPDRRIAWRIIADCRVRRYRELIGVETDVSSWTLKSDCSLSDKGRRV